jgi:hypothetical protein
VGWAFATHPPEVAWDIVWPSYAGKAYYTIYPISERFPVWRGWKYFVRRQLVPASGMTASLLVAYSLFRKLRSDDRSVAVQAGLLVPPLFFFLGIGTYIGHISVYQMYYWFLSPAVAVLIAHRPRAGVLFFLLWLPGNLFAVRETFFPTAKVISSTLPDGHRVNWGLEHLEACRFLAKEAAKASNKPLARPLIMPIGSGFSLHYGLVSPTRNTWVIPGHVRPYDELAYLEVADRIPFIGFVGGAALAEKASFTELVGPALGPRVTAKLKGRIYEEVRVNSLCRVYRLR